MAETSTLLSGGALAVVILREAFSGIRAILAAQQPHKPNGVEKFQTDVLARLEAIREDTKANRQYAHTIINQLQAQKNGTDLMIRHLEKL